MIGALGSMFIQEQRGFCSMTISEAIDMVDGFTDSWMEGAYETNCKVYVDQVVCVSWKLSVT